jgi:hypothetical protein
MVSRRRGHPFVRLASFTSSLPLSVTAAYRRMLQGGASEKVCYEFQVQVITMVGH